MILVDTGWHRDMSPGGKYNPFAQMKCLGNPVPGISIDKQQQRSSLEWVREQSLSPDCVAVLANHDPAVKARTIE